MCEDLLRKEKAKLFKYRFISSDISIGLDYILKRKKIPGEYKENIQEGIKFLEDAINGNTLITGKKIQTSTQQVKVLKLMELL